MESVLKKIGEFSGAVGDFREMVIKTIKDVSEKKEASELTRIEQDTRKKDLDAREIEIKKVEDVIKLKQETQELIRQAEKDSLALQKNQEIAKENIIKANTLIAKGNSENERVRISNEAESKALVRGREELEKDKKEFKLKLAQGLVEQADKR